MENVQRAIAEGLANAKADPNEWGNPVAPSVLAHPNSTLLLPPMNTFTITRKVMDKSQGDDGLIRLNVRAVSGADAAAEADRMVARINAPFREQNDKRSRRV
jgi:hypothetical protein